MNNLSSVVAARSKDGAYVALGNNSTSGSATLRLSLYHQEQLQTTLTHKVEKATNIQKLLFVRDSGLFLAALCETSDVQDEAKTMVVVWDLDRGVVAYETRDVTVFDMATHGNNWYWLVFSDSRSRRSSGTSKHSPKLQIHQVNPATGNVTAKVKAGKLSGGDEGAEESVTESSPSLLVTSVDGDTDYGIVQNAGQVRVLNLDSGKKVTKFSTAKNASSGPNSSLMALVFANRVAVFLANSGKIGIVDIASGKTMHSWKFPASGKVSLQSWQHSNDTTFLLVNQTHLYQCQQEDKEPSLVTVFHMDASLDQAVVLSATKSASVALQKQGRWQFQNLVKETMESQTNVSWQDATNGKLQSDENAKRRKNDNHLALGPVQAGGEAFGVSEGPVKKKARTSDEGEHEDDMLIDEEGLVDAAGPSIAERLAQLDHVLAQEDSDDDDEQEERKKQADFTFQPKKATTESLVHLLRQALQSGDDGLLELALSVKDKRILRETCEALDNHDTDDSARDGESNLSSRLMTALTSRLVSKPARAEHLCVWISVLLQTGKLRSRHYLQPLRNLIQERLEIFPALLKLDGRLSLLNS